MLTTVEKVSPLWPIWIIFGPMKNLSTYMFRWTLLTTVKQAYFFGMLMRRKGFSPIPVYHYQADEKYLKYYAKRAELIAIGGTVPEHNKRIVAEWVRVLVWTYPEIRFHLLGSSSRKIVDTVDLHSVDSSTWIMQAKNGRPYHIPGKTPQAKVKRAVYNLEKEINLFEE